MPSIVMSLTVLFSSSVITSCLYLFLTYDFILACQLTVKAITHSLLPFAMFYHPAAAERESVLKMEREKKRKYSEVNFDLDGDEVSGIVSSSQKEPFVDTLQMQTQRAKEKEKDSIFTSGDYESEEPRRSSRNRFLSLERACILKGVDVYGRPFDSSAPGLVSDWAACAGTGGGGEDFLEKAEKGDSSMYQQAVLGIGYGPDGPYLLDHGKVRIVEEKDGVHPCYESACNEESGEEGEDDRLGGGDIVQEFDDLLSEIEDGKNGNVTGYGIVGEREEQLELKGSAKREVHDLNDGDADDGGDKAAFVNHSGLMSEAPEKDNEDEGNGQVVCENDRGMNVTAEVSLLVSIEGSSGTRSDGSHDVGQVTSNNYYDAHSDISSSRTGENICSVNQHEDSGLDNHFGIVAGSTGKTKSKSKSSHKIGRAHV